jgi:hypothetical protein
MGRTRERKEMKSHEFITEEEATTYDIAKRKYPDSPFPETMARNKRDKAKKRLDRMKNPPSKDTGGGDSNIGSPVGSSSDNNY